MTKKIVIDLDDTISIKAEGQSYEAALPRHDVISKIHEYKQMGFTICVFTARNMRTFDGNVGRINAVTLPIILAWLENHNVPYDEVVIGKPWCGSEGFYVDDKAVRPHEFASLSFLEIKQLLKDG